MALALATGIAPAAWAAEGERAIATAYALLRERDQDNNDQDDRQLSG